MPSRKTRIKHASIVEVFAERLRALRQARQMTQRDLAERAHVTLSYISRLEAGGAAPGIDLLERLAQALSVSLAELLPSPASADSSEVYRQQAKELFAAVLEKAGHESLLMLTLFLGRLAESPGLRR